MQHRTGVTADSNYYFRLIQPSTVKSNTSLEGFRDLKRRTPNIDEPSTRRVLSNHVMNQLGVVKRGYGCYAFVCIFTTFDDFRLTVRLLRVEMASRASWFKRGFLAPPPISLSFSFTLGYPGNRDP